MPVKIRQPKLAKKPCSMCHRLVEELRYHYDICEPCHADFLGEESESEGYSDSATNDGIDSQSDMESDFEEEEPDEDTPNGGVEVEVVEGDEEKELSPKKCSKL